MKRFLLRIGTLWVGMVTIIVVLTTLIAAGADESQYGTEAPGVGAFFGGVFLWLVSLGVGLALSAPAFLDPPEDNGGMWAFIVPLPLWMFLMVLKLASWIGFSILLGAWLLIFKVWHNHQSKSLPTFGAAPTGAAGSYASGPGGGSYGAGSYGNPFATGAPAAPGGSSIPPSWQTDPTGRFGYRWWDGASWTDRVANGSNQIVDPL
ncbi:MAG TPA: hypothetical protein VFG35_09700 [Actinoplanes sp.]|nr:hypothetical protein [Actinoplanes sp.]